MILSQSYIKNLLDYNHCPLKFKTHDMDRLFDKEPSQVMFRGIYFEYITLGNLPKSEVVPVYPELKRTKKRTHEIHKERIDQQIAKFEQILVDQDIQLVGGGEVIQYRYSPGLILSIHIDAIVIHKGKLYVMDLKLTQDINSTFGPFAWGAFDYMDKLQAHLYSYVFSQIFKEKIGFIYLVFDYKKSGGEHKVFEATPTEEDLSRMFTRIEKAELKMHWNESSGFKPRPSKKACSGCLIKDCIARFSVEEPKAVNNSTQKKSKPKSVLVDIDALLENALNF
jgi:hypothetical protein